MKKVILSSIIFCLSLSVFSQRKTNSFYEIITTFKNKPYKRGLETSKAVPLFEINLPNIVVKDVNIDLSLFVYEITFIDNSKIIIVGDISSKDVNINGQIFFNRKNLEKTMEDNSLEDIVYTEKHKIQINGLFPNNGFKIEKNRFNSLVQKKEFLIFYFNVRKKDVELFNESINSFKILNTK